MVAAWRFALSLAVLAAVDAACFNNKSTQHGDLSYGPRVKLDRTRTVMFTLTGAKNDVRLSFSATNEADPAYEIVLGGWGNTKSVIRRNGLQVTQKVKANVLKPNALGFYWVSLTKNVLTVGTGRIPGKGVLMSHLDKKPLNATYFAVLRGWGRKDNWKLCMTAVDCKVSAWKAQYTKACGQQMVTSVRKILQPPSKGGKACPSKLTKTDAVCRPCDCVASEWSDWSTCSKSCATGVHYRAREIVTAATCGGKQCANMQQTQTCTPKAKCCSHVVCRQEKIFVKHTATEKTSVHSRVKVLHSGKEQNGRHHICKVGLFTPGRCDCECGLIGFDFFSTIEDPPCTVWATPEQCDDYGDPFPIAKTHVYRGSRVDIQAEHGYLYAATRIVEKTGMRQAHRYPANKPHPNMFIQFELPYLSYARFMLDVEKSGMHTLKIHYSLGTHTKKALQSVNTHSAVSMHLTVAYEDSGGKAHGLDSQFVHFDTTQSWKNWAWASTSIKLMSGTCVLKLHAIGEGGPDIDDMLIQPVVVKRFRST